MSTSSPSGLTDKMRCQRCGARWDQRTDSESLRHCPDPSVHKQENEVLRTLVDELWSQLGDYARSLWSEPWGDDPESVLLRSIVDDDDYRTLAVVPAVPVEGQTK